MSQIPKSKSAFIPRASVFGGRVNLFRIYCIAAATLVTGLIVMVQDPEHAWDPLPLRLSLSLYFIGILAGSYFIEFIRKYFEGAFALGMTLLAGWECLLMGNNAFGAEFMAGFSILAITSVLLFEDRRVMGMFTGTSSVLLVVTALLATADASTVWAFVGVSLTIFLIGNVTVIARALTRTKLEISLSHLLTIQEAALESNSDAILLVDQQGHYLKANTSFCKMWGIAPVLIAENRQEESVAIAKSLVADPESLERLWVGIEGEIGIGELFEIEFKDGRVVETYWRPMINEDVLIGRLWLFRDITQVRQRERKQLRTERRLRQQNERLMDFAADFVANSGNLEATFMEITRVSTALLDVDRVGVWFFDEGTMTMRLSLQFDRNQSTFSRNAEVDLRNHPEYHSHLFQQRVYVVDDTVNNPATEAFQFGVYSGKAAALMHAQIRAHGKGIGLLSFECSQNVREWTTEDQHFAASLADLVSIALASEEKQRAQQELTNSSAILQAIFDLSETGIIVEDGDHNILKYNELYLKIWGMTKEFIDTQPYEVLLARCLEQLKNTQTIQEGLDKLKSRPGMEYAGIMEFLDGKVIERYSKALHVDGQLKGRVWFYLDITDRKRKETELINRNFELDSFVYRASHDLKAPLNSIMGLISLIREEEELDMILRYVGMMDKSVKKLDDFIRQLTQFSQDARLKLVRKEIDFHEMVHDILGDLKYMENAQRLAVTVDIQQKGTFFSDPVRLGIVFSNFLSNAIKYQDLRKEKSTLHVGIEVDENVAKCTFSDNGLGIDAEHLEKVFDLFFRASVQATGSGLGLYITHNAIQKLGGTVQVTSELGKGSNFTITLPNLSTEEEPEPVTTGDSDSPAV